MNSRDVTLEGIRSAFRLFCRSEQAEGRRRLLAIWEELGSGGDPFLRCVAAHYLADTEDDLREELGWDLRALEVADSISAEGSDPHPSAAAIQAFYPSLHLNLADDYRKLGDFENARRHADLGNEAGGGLGLDAYGQSVRAGLIRVDTQIEERDSGPSMIFDFD